VEGLSEDPDVLACRERLKRAIMGTMILSQGAPMILGGDELSRTQSGNNTAYNQDNEINWFDWDLDAREAEFLHFVRQAVAFRRRHPNVRRRQFLTGIADEHGVKDAMWWHASGREMDWEDWQGRGVETFGLLLRGDRIPGTDRKGRPREADTMLLLFNKGGAPHDLVLPAEPAGSPLRWRAEAPFDEGVEPSYAAGATVSLPSNSLTVLSAVPSGSAASPPRA
jgi:glycogen operon protein